MTGHHRRIIKALKRHAPGMQATLVRESRHLVMDFSYADRVTRITMSLTPSNGEHEYRNTCSDVCKALNLPRMTH